MSTEKLGRTYDVDRDKRPEISCDNPEGKDLTEAEGEYIKKTVELPAA